MQTCWCWVSLSIFFFLLFKGGVLHLWESENTHSSPGDRAQPQCKHDSDAAFTVMFLNVTKQQEVRITGSV